MDDIFHTAELGVAVVTGIFSLIGTIYWVAKRIAQMEFRVNTMWDFIMRRGLVEAINKGVLEMNSPISLPNETANWYDKISERLRSFYQTRKRLNDRDFWIAVESEFGEWITWNVCLPKGLNVGACIAAAIAVAKTPDPKADSDKPQNTKVEQS